MALCPAADRSDFGRSLQDAPRTFQEDDGAECDFLRAGAERAGSGGEDEKDLLREEEEEERGGGAAADRGRSEGRLIFTKLQN